MANGMHPTDNWYNLGLLGAMLWGKNRSDREFNRELKDAETANTAPSTGDIGLAEEFLRKRQGEEYAKNLVASGAMGTANNPKWDYSLNLGGNNSSGLFASIFPSAQAPGGNDTEGLAAGFKKKYFPNPAEKQPETPPFGTFLNNYGAEIDRGRALQESLRLDDGEVKGLSEVVAKQRRANEDYSAEADLANLRKGWAQRGVTPENQERLMAVFAPEAHERQRKQNEQKSDALVTEYNKHFKAGNYDEAFALLPQIAKYNQPAAQMLYGGGVTPKDKYNFANQQKLNAENFERNKEAMVLRGSLGGYGGGSRSASGNSNAKPPAYLGVVGQQIEKAFQAIDSGDNDLSGKEIDRLKLLLKRFPDMAPEHQDEAQMAIYALNAKRELKAGYLETALQYARALPPGSLEQFGIDIEGLTQAVEQRKPREEKEQSQGLFRTYLENNNVSSPQVTYNSDTGYVKDSILDKTKTRGGLGWIVPTLMPNLYKKD